MKNRDGTPINDHWSTPRDLYEKLDAEFHFDFDPCPLHSTFDGLSSSVAWGRSNFINPPYNAKDKPRFIQRAFDEWKKGATCVLLIPAAVSTRQFHELIYPNAEIRFVKGRLKFGDAKHNAKHDSMIIVFRGKSRGPVCVENDSALRQSVPPSAGEGKRCPCGCDKPVAPGACHHWGGHNECPECRPAASSGEAGEARNG